MIENFTIPVGVLRPAGALAMLAVGFVGARLAPNMGPLSGLRIADVNPSLSHVRLVEPTSDGQVRIVLDEIRQASPKGLIIRSAKENFIAGADVEEFTRFKSPEEALAFVRLG